MSILFTLRKLIDPQTHQEEVRRAKIARELPRGTRISGKADAPKAEAPAEPPKHYRCRACHWEGEQRQYCPHCLADTMEPLEGEGGSEGARERGREVGR